MRIEAWTGHQSVHYYRDCHGVGPITRRVLAEAGTLRCPTCIARLIEERGALTRQAPRQVRVIWLDADGNPVKRPCGTHAAYARHKAAGEEPCEECVQAEREYQRQRWLRRKAAA